MSFQTVEDMQDRLRNMCDEIDCLKYELEKAASDERAKIVAWLLDRKQMSDFYIDHNEAEEIAQYVKDGEHLK